MYLKNWIWKLPQIWSSKIRATLGRSIGLPMIVRLDPSGWLRQLSKISWGLSIKSRCYINVNSTCLEMYISSMLALHDPVRGWHDLIDYRCLDLVSNKPWNMIHLLPCRTTCRLFTNWNFFSPSYLQGTMTSRIVGIATHSHLTQWSFMSK